MADPAASADDVIELIVNGQRYSGWTEVSIDIGIDNLASAFSLTVTERSPDDGASAAAWLAEAGAAVQVTIAGETVISGYIDAANPSLSAADHSITISGRSRAADLIDCSAVHATGSWAGQTLAQIAGDLAKPLGVTVTVEGDAGAPFRKFALQPGESVFEALDRAAKMRGLLLISASDGGVIITNPKPQGSPLRIEQGKHFTDINATHDASQRFSRYIVKGQSAGSDDVAGRAASGLKAEASDAGIKRDRPLIIIAEDQATLASLQTRAAWEASVRRAKAQSVTVTMPGWREPQPQGSGPVWKAMRAVDLVAPAGYAQGPMMVAAISFTLGSGGRTASLTLAHPDAYQPEPVPADAEAGRIKRGQGS